MQQVDPGLPDAVNRRQVAVLQAMARELGVQPAVEQAAMLAIPTWPLLRGLLEWVANHSGVDEAVIRDFLRDVSVYLELPGCRAAVQEVVRPSLLTDHDDVLVGNSLGGVVCAELLAEDEVRDRVAVFVAIGAPLGLDACTDGMRPAGSARPTSPWVNVFDLRDWVTLARRCTRAVGSVGLAVANPRSYEHSIEHYLAHPEVATVIAEALDARAWPPEAPIQDPPGLSRDRRWTEPETTGSQRGEREGRGGGGGGGDRRGEAVAQLHCRARALTISILSPTVS